MATIEDYMEINEETGIVSICGFSLSTTEDQWRELFSNVYKSIYTFLSFPTWVCLNVGVLLLTKGVIDIYELMQRSTKRHRTRDEFDMDTTIIFSSTSLIYISVILLTVVATSRVVNCYSHMFGKTIVN